MISTVVGYEVYTSAVCGSFEDTTKVQAVYLEAGKSKEKYVWSSVWRDGENPENLVSPSALAAAKKEAERRGLSVFGLKEVKNPVTGAVSHLAKLASRDYLQRIPYAGYASCENKDYWIPLDSKDITPRTRLFEAPPSEQEKLEALKRTLEAEKYGLYLSARHLAVGDLAESESKYAKKCIADATDNLLQKLPRLDKKHPLHGKTITPDTQKKIVAEVIKSFFTYTDSLYQNHHSLTVKNDMFGKRVNPKTDTAIARKVDELFGQISFLGQKAIKAEKVSQTPSWNKVPSGLSAIEVMALSGMFFSYRKR